MDTDATTRPPTEAPAPGAPATADPVPSSEFRAPRSDWEVGERISWFPIPAEEELDPRVADLVRRQREKLGAPNNVVRVHAWRPELMLRWL